MSISYSVFFVENGSATMLLKTESLEQAKHYLNDYMRKQYPNGTIKSVAKKYDIKFYVKEDVFGLIKMSM